MVTDSIIERIQALLRMAEHPNSNEHEAAIALERAQAMLLENNLTRASVNTGPEAATTPDPVGKVEVGYKVSWESTLLNTIAKANLCRVIGSRAGEHKAHLFGAKGNVLTVLAMFEWVKEQLETVALREWTEYKAGRGSESSRSWRPAFFLGACLVLQKRLAPPLQAFAAGPGRALVLSNDQRVSLAVKSVFPHLGSSRTTINYGSDGYGAGQRAGANVRFGRTAALGYGGQQQLAGGG